MFTFFYLSFKTIFFQMSSLPKNLTRKSILFFFFILCFLISSPIAQAGPAGGQVISGNATIAQQGPVTDINQSSQKASINWQGFSSGPAETINFNQPNSQAMTLNRVVGNERSVIEGALNANGKVFIVNSNGILFSQGSRVNVGALVATTRNITDEDFNNGRYVFQGQGQGKVVNKGDIKSADGGYVALLGAQVVNDGVITATKGTVALSAGDKATLNFNGDSLLDVSLEEGTLEALVENNQAVIADGGNVYLTAKAANSIATSQVNNNGVVRARTIGDLKGKIVAYAHGGTANINGTLDASAPNTGDGGFIETSGKKVKIAPKATLTAKSAQGKSGSWLIDPGDYIIGGENSDRTALDLMYDLMQFAVVEISSTADSVSGDKGDIIINDTISWNGHTLKLTAENDIYINKALNIYGAGGLEMNFGGDYHILTKASYSGAEVVEPNPEVAGAGASRPKEDTSGGIYGSVNFDDPTGTLKINDKTYNLIFNLNDLINIKAPIQGTMYYYALANNIDLENASFTRSIVPDLSAGQITFAGLGHSVDNWTIDSPGSGYIGFFGRVYRSNTTSEIRDFGVNDFKINYATNTNNTYHMGSLVGYMTGNLKQVYSIGTIKLIGAFTDENKGSIIVTVGGLVGQLIGSGIYIREISNSFAKVNIDITGSSNPISGVGGLIGYGMNVNIKNSHAMGYINAPIASRVGGLGGSISALSVIDSYFSGEFINGSESVGGLFASLSGLSEGAYSILNCFATGIDGEKGVITRKNITSNDLSTAGAGGLIGIFLNVGLLPTTVYNSYANMDIISENGYASAGLIAYMSVRTPYSATISYSHATGDITTKSFFNRDDGVEHLDSAGGLISTIQGTIKELIFDFCYTSGNVTNVSYIAGGLFGHATSNNTTVKNSYASGDIVSSSNIAGGLFGFFEGDIINSFSTVKEVNGVTVGGLIGIYSGGNILSSYSTSTLYSSETAGGLYGRNFYANQINEIKNSYYDGDIIGNPTYAGGIAGHIEFDVLGVDATGNTIIENSYFNGDKLSELTAFGNDTSQYQYNHSDNIKGLTGEDAADIMYFADGTIEQVRADRAAQQPQIPPDPGTEEEETPPVDEVVDSQPEEGETLPVDEVVDSQPEEGETLPVDEVVDSSPQDNSSVSVEIPTQADASSQTEIQKALSLAETVAPKTSNFDSISPIAKQGGLGALTAAPTLSNVSQASFNGSVNFFNSNSLDTVGSIGELLGGNSNPSASKLSMDAGVRNVSIEGKNVSISSGSSTAGRSGSPTTSTGGSSNQASSGQSEGTSTEDDE